MAADNPFDQLTLADLRQRSSAKWRVYPEDVLPLWVAEMDAPLAPPIADALRGYLASFADPIVMHDTGIDLMLLGEALSHPEATAPLPRLRPNLINLPGYIQGIERIFSSNTALRLQRHHALIDARVARDAFLACVR